MVSTNAKALVRGGAHPRYQTYAINGPISRAATRHQSPSKQRSVSAPHIAPLSQRF
jgi:hypothetical protein